MPFNINDFRSHMDKTGFIKASSFMTQITPPSNIDGSIVADLPFLTENALLPGVNFQTDLVRPKGYGLTERRPVEVGYEELTVEIVCDAKGRVQNFLDSWRDAVFSQGSGGQSERWSYPMDYYGTVILMVYNNGGDQILEYTFEQAYPTTIGAVAYGWGNTDSLVTISVQFAYRKWELNRDGSGSSSVSSQTSDNARNVTKIINKRERPSVSEYINRFEAI